MICLFKSVIIFFYHSFHILPYVNIRDNIDIKEDTLPNVVYQYYYQMFLHPKIRIILTDILGNNKDVADAIMMYLNDVKL